MAKLEIGAEPAHSGMNLFKTKIMRNYVVQESKLLGSSPHNSFVKPQEQVEMFGCFHDSSQYVLFSLLRSVQPNYKLTPSEVGSNL